MKKRVKWIKWLVLGICIAFIAGLLQYWNREERHYPGVELYSDGELLFYKDRKSEKTYFYDSESKKEKEFLDESIHEIYSNDKYYFYSCKSGIYIQERATGKKDVIIEYGKEMPDRIKEHRGQKLLNTSVSEEAQDFCEYNGQLYFVYRARVGLKSDEHSSIGTENWFTLYRYDTSTKTLTSLKSDHSTTLYDAFDESKDAIDHEAVMFDMHIVDHKIYYRTYEAVHCLTLDGREDCIIYLFEGSVKRFNWMKDGFSYLESISGNEWYLKAIDYNGEMMNSHQIPYDMLLTWGAYSHLVYYDEQTDTYLAFSDEKLIRFSGMSPEKYTIITGVERNKTEDMVNLITIGDTLYIATWNEHAHNNYDYRIIELNGKNEIKVIVDIHNN